MNPLFQSPFDPMDGEPTRADYCEAGEAAGFYFAAEAFPRFSASLVPGLGGMAMDEAEKAAITRMGRQAGGRLFDQGMPLTLRTFSEVMAPLFALP